jgi:hypothetical protein
MSMTLLRRLGLALAGTGIALALAACGGGGDDDGGGSGPASVRLLNLTGDVAGLDLYSELNDVETVRNENVAPDTAGAFADLSSGNYDLLIKRSGEQTALLQQTSRALTKGNKYSVLTFGSAGAYQSALIGENEAVADTGKHKLRILNLAADAGLAESDSTELGRLDVYVTAANVTLDNASPVATLAGGAVSSYNSINSGTVRIRVITAGDKDEESLLLDIPSVTLDSTGVTTLVLTSTNGGVLVNGYVLPQGGALVPAKNTSARVRLVASVPNSGAVGATINNVALSTGLPAPLIDRYKLVPAGAMTGTILVNGAPVTVPTDTLVAGNDYTLLVAGNTGAASAFVIGDDNRLPSSSVRTKVRLINGLVGDTQGLTLTINFNPVAVGTPFGQASAALLVNANTTAGTTSDVKVTSPGAGNVFDDDIAFASRGVYTVFVLSGSAQPSGQPRRDR